MGVDARDLETARTAISQTQGDVVVMFGGELSAEAQAVVAQMPYTFAGEGRRVLLHPLPLFNNSVGAHDMAQGEARSALICCLPQANQSARCTSPEVCCQRICRKISTP